ncbi:MAG: NAD-dependent epimerase/dehydratase family protein [Caldilineaceae bacterium]|nr:NAD-dependent epimerase/dehydratase family protein [Caldilineaceae bacterium]
MRKKVIFITGASGEVGHALVKRLAAQGTNQLLTMDIRALPADVRALTTHIEGDLLNERLLARLVSEYEIDVIYHLAALLSTRSEITPEEAHQVNVEATMALLRLAAEESQWRGRAVQFIFPSSIAIYGMPDRESKELYTRVREWEWNQPRTMYGCNKLYCETLGSYFSRHYRQLAAEQPATLDFRCVRFPGLISAFTLPSGGTSDYAPEMVHAAAKGEPYACFVPEDARIPFMAMPDAVDALLALAELPRSGLSRLVYNVTSFSISAGEIRERVLRAFPNAQITFAPDTKRSAIIDSWPADMDDSVAQRDWGWRPKYTVERAFDEYLIPNVVALYDKK